MEIYSPISCFSAIEIYFQLSFLKKKVSLSISCQLLLFHVFKLPLLINIQYTPVKWDSQGTIKIGPT